MSTPAGGLDDVEGVLIDVDDTLLDNRAAIRHTIATVARAYLPADVDVDEATAFFRADANGHYRAFTRGEIDSRTQRWRRARELHERFGGPDLGESEIGEWIATFDAAYAAGWRVHADSLAFLAALEERGLMYGVLSNARRAQQVAKLAAVGLSDVPLLVCVDDHGYGKPDPRVFLEACRLLGTDPARTVYVGDEYDIDAAAAVRAGLVGVWCDRPGAWNHWDGVDPAADGVIRVASLAELASLLAPRSAP